MEVTVLGKGVRQWMICHLRKTTSFPCATCWRPQWWLPLSCFRWKAVGDCKPPAG